MILDRLPPESAKCSPRRVNGFCNSLSSGGVFFFKRCSASQSIEGRGGGGELNKNNGPLFPFLPQAPILYAVIFFENSFVAHESQYFKGEGAPGLIDCVSFQNSFYKGRVRIPRPPLYRVFPSSLQLIQNIVLTIFY